LSTLFRSAGRVEAFGPPSEVLHRVVRTGGGNSAVRPPPTAPAKPDAPARIANGSETP